MHAIVVSVAAAVILLGTTSADARPRFRFKSSSPSPLATPSPAPRAPAQATQGAGILPGAVMGGSIGASRGARARSDAATADTPTGSTTPAPDHGTLGTVTTSSPIVASSPKPIRKPRPACARGATFGGGFCEVN